jgi:hypothetical protein
MTTYLELQQRVSREVGDPDQETFDPQDVKDFISAAWSEISRIHPKEFTEVITPNAVPDGFPLMSADFDSPPPGIELKRVEIWTVDPYRAWRFIEPRSQHPMGLSYSEAGWFVWGGNLSIPTRWADLMTAGQHVLRVWGYGPWAPLSSDSDDVPFGDELTEAAIIYCRVQSLRRLSDDRTLFTQWQTRTNNTNMPTAALYTMLNQAEDEWRRISNRLFLLRESA